VVHLLALLIFLGWLWQSGRLNVDRAKEIKGKLAMTVSEERAAEQKVLAEKEAHAQREIDDQLKADPPVGSGAQLVRLATMQQHEAQAKRRLQDEKKMLNQQLAQVTATVDEKEAEFKKQRDEWMHATAVDRDKRVDEQFTKAVRQYEQTTPKQGKKMLVELINDSKRDQAVAYMNAMNPRALSKIIKEFKTDEEVKLATGLLEDMAKFGVEADSQKEPSNVDGLANSDQPAENAPNSGAKP
jgi:hypothetical protein